MQCSEALNLAALNLAFCVFFLDLMEEADETFASMAVEGMISLDNMVYCHSGNKYIWQPCQFEGALHYRSGYGAERS